MADRCIYVLCIQKENKELMKESMYVCTDSNKLKEKNVTFLCYRVIMLLWFESSCPLRRKSHYTLINKLFIPTDHLYPDEIMKHFSLGRSGLFQKDSTPIDRA